MNLEKTNTVFLQGEIASEPVFSHEYYGEKFYSFSLCVKRLSEECDILPITISERIMSGIKPGNKIALRGQFRSHNKFENGRSRLELFVFCRELCEYDNNANSNVIELTGYICKPPVFRNTPLLREICDVLLAVNRGFSKSDYIPCIAWGRNARFVRELPVGACLNLSGRIQSREYKKQVEGQEPVSRLAYEVSISNVAMLSNDKTSEQLDEQTGERAEQIDEPISANQSV